jgi:phosphopantothenoylcysteine decarboxylase/phosphopantothenate--cysteine ligase
MFNAVVSELKSKKYDVTIAVAAVADWTPEQPFSNKLSTHTIRSLDLKLKPTKKIIDAVKKVSPKTFLVAFRAEYKLPKNELIDSAYKRLLEANADLIAVNDVGKPGAGFGTDTNELFVVDKKRNVTHIRMADKREVARKILDIIRERVKPK